MENIKVVVWGLGAMGSGIAKMILSKKGMEIVGAIDTDPNKVGKDLNEILGTNSKPVYITSEPQDVIKKGSADIAVIATSSYVEKVFPLIKLAVESGINVITTAEEMAYPSAQHPELAKEIDRLAKENGVSALGTGINPGFVLDYLIIALTGACVDVESIKAARINDLSPFGKAVMEEQGVGLTPEEFEEGVKKGTVAGHIGFPESISMICDALGWKLSGIEQIREPIISKTYRETPYAKVEPGYVAGCRQIGFGKVDGEVKIELEHPQQILPQKEGVETGDYIEIKGTPTIKVSIKPEIPGGLGTIALCVNTIPHVINAQPGLVTMLDLPVPRAIMGDARDMIRRR
ncbi:2,4-diaminopentanoate dehydrogenase [Thermoanaerobacter brockii subsp. lactiethylicus]|jgi:4-hydroxy-tetrahydrodipicolinate reductase|uniref:Dihydrodipicolinate reductase n=2 Tax=Thermoanaerobacter TaxID=1754 RepID=B0K982_THEP3|nr:MULTISPECIES: 2,4-diaminopentanoate dehydrogenase [Thermoanaerobacter]ABY94695.1 dihydrodipicolinate reductase [Thermoanaerobacter pseudethanolicus ATCC 33223]ADV79643.1 dihydrodipicolinate reductase [Thermoanaerobacter brockii subsp. finnii Ako-1]HBW60690.1 NADP-binding protein [Thermoanaerobacter sp.]